MMRGTRIPHDAIEAAAYEAHRLAATTLPADVRAAFRAMRDREREELPKTIMATIVENFEVADADQRPLCADVGVPRVYAIVGNEVAVEGGFIAFGLGVVGLILYLGFAQETRGIELERLDPAVASNRGFARTADTVQ